MASRLQKEALIQQQKNGADLAAFAIKTLNIASGGALLAVLSFLGNLIAKNEQVASAMVKRLGLAIILFTAAFIISIATAMAAYMSALAHTYRLAGERNFLGRHAFSIRAYAIALAIVALAIFAAGAIVAALALSSM